ncbi:hypothetical protein R3X27_24440 [Tropicimonas sp. TH_r6]|uniref:hypothetical protein n=1 Tax=Tropicimonas sp. TH_r6 TaxID=3082085 RepID=UPI0029541E26|nr:hypothetical protein [Tropicimonas sp. TH_r6]MDV7145840.1 hypothetical protein [Tropicimonas sp. TH_r6]
MLGDQRKQMRSRLTTACQWVVRIVGVFYLFALALLLVGTFGLFDQERDPLAGVFLMPLGLPWVLWLDGFPDRSLPWLATLAPLLNLTILTLLCRYVRSDTADEKTTQ